MSSMSAAPVLAGSITEDKLADGAVTENKLAVNSVSNGKIQGSAIGGGKIQNSAIGKDKLKWQTVTLAGAVGWGVDIAMTSYSIFPMVHTDSGTATMTGHPTDGASGESPRFRLEGQNDGTSYDVDYRYINS